METIQVTPEKDQKRKIPWGNLGIGACMNVFQVTTLGQPMEAGAHRSDTLADAIRKTWFRAGFRGFYQGLIPWAWLEASTKGAILILTSTEVERHAKMSLGASNTAAGVLGGVAGGAAQAYLTMGVTTCMKTVEVTRAKNIQPGGKIPGTMATFFNILRTKGIRGVNRGVNAVALRQITGWSSRIGISRFAEGNIRALTGKSPTQKLSFSEKIAASTVGGALSCWNQPFEVLRIEMQSLKADPTRPASPTMVNTAKHILKTSGPAGFFRGVVPRIGVAAWATICMVGFGDMVKEVFDGRGK
ncbi:mitochondrial carrier domain-containing protein [Plectosphaerella plurivora]|uniref:Mitochondrial carrier domain-containing protein n=1 Tax=Plectosphaerella plurivora TaxID=936078 RepID=A0A9P9A6T7_9PEZI|nr:mitochondrial carrier domain-containing protein [Plectosphaerella plurivora]